MTDIKMKKSTRYIILILALQLLNSCDNSEIFSETVSIPETKIKLKSDFNYVAGNSIWMKIETADKKKIKVDLIITNGLTTTTTSQLTNNTTKLSAGYFKTSGLYDLLVLYKGHVLKKRQLIIKTAEIIEPLDVYTGPSSIVVGGKQPSMITTIPTDKYDNAIVKDLSLDIKSKGGERLNSTVPIKNLIGNYEFISENEVNKIVLGVSHNDMSSREKEINETPDWPTEYKIEVVKHYPYADNRQYLRLRTSRIKDALGNQIADGTLVNFHCLEENQVTATYKAIVIDKVIKIGPLKSTQGQLIPDGTIVTITHQSKKYFIETMDGIADINLVDLGILTKDLINISVAGHNETINL